MNLNSIKNALFAAIHGITPEEFELQKARDNLKSVTAQHLEKHPEYLKSSPVDTSTKVKRISKSLGADSRPVVSHTTDHIDPEMLAKAKAAAAALAKSDPDRYGNIIQQQGAE